MTILQVFDEYKNGGLDLFLVDDRDAAWVTKGSGRTPRRALQAVGYRLTAFRPDPRFRPPGTPPNAVHMTFGPTTFHKKPRDTFWRSGPWNYQQTPYDPGWGYAGWPDERGAFEAWSDDHLRARLASDEPAAMALDTLMEIYHRAPPEGVYDLDAVVARANPPRRRRARR